MNILHRFTRCSLAENRVRTLVTIIGIVLSMSLFTAVIEGAYSGLQYMIRSEEERVGAFQGYVSGLSREEIDSLPQSDIQKSTVWQRVGWAEFGSQNEYKPYLLFEAFEPGFENLVKIRLSEGRMPETEEECLIPNHLYTNAGVVYSLGDTLTFSVGQRPESESGHSDLSYDPGSHETLTDIETRTYTVVGFYDRLDYEIEPFSLPGYTVLTAGGGQGSCRIFFTMKHPSMQTLERLERSVTELGGTLVIHSDLLELYGVIGNQGVRNVLYGFAAILVFLISFGAVSLIYNSFSISVSERTRQFGILKSVGATKKQIRSAVLYEALLLSAIGIPVGLVVGCAGIGITLYALRDAFAAIMSNGVGTRIRLVLNPAALSIAVFVCLVTTLISAWIPAGRAIRISPIDAIRQSKDVKITGKTVKTSRLTQKLFGFEGLLASKNFKRNRKRYRSTVISLFMSITLFVSSSSLCSYLASLVKGMTANVGDYDIYARGYEISESEAFMKLAANIEGVKKFAGERKRNFDVYFPAHTLTADTQALFGVAGIGDDATDIPLDLRFIDDVTFRQLCRDNGINEDRYFDPESPRGLLFNEPVVKVSDGAGGMKRHQCQLIKPSSLPVTAETIQIHDRLPDGYYYVGNRMTDSGRQYYYFPEEEIIKREDPENLDTYDLTKAIVLSEGEAVDRFTYRIEDIVHKLPFYMTSTNGAIFYPMSMIECVGGHYMKEGFPVSIYLQAPQHRLIASELEKKISESGLNIYVTDEADAREMRRMEVKIINVFSYGFIVLISLIAVANVFNTVSTSIALRRREFAMLKSIGLSDRGFRKMMNFECLIFGLKSLLYGLPASFLMTYAIYRIILTALERSFYIPWEGVLIAIGSVFAVVFATMFYATAKLKNDNPIDALKNENV